MARSLSEPLARVGRARPTRASRASDRGDRRQLPGERPPTRRRKEWARFAGVARPMDPARAVENSQTEFPTALWTALENAPPTGSTGPHRRGDEEENKTGERQER